MSSKNLIIVIYFLISHNLTLYVSFNANVRFISQLFLNFENQ